MPDKDKGGRGKLKDQTKISANLQLAKSYTQLPPGSAFHRQLAAAARGGGKAVDDYFGWVDQLARKAKAFTDYIREQGTKAFEAQLDGEGNEVLVVNPPYGAATGIVRAHGFTDTRSDPDTDVEYQAIGELNVDVGGEMEHLTEILAKVKEGVEITDAVVWVLERAVLGAIRNGTTEFVKKFENEAENADDIDSPIDEASDGAIDAATDTEIAAEEGIELTVETLAEVLEIVGTILTVISIALLIAELMEKQFRHRLEVQNLTEVTLELADPWVDHGAMALTPKGGDGVGPRLWSVLEPREDGYPYYVSTCTYMAANTNPWRGLGYVIAVKPNAALPNGLVAMLDIPYNDPNSIWVSFDVAGNDWEQVWAEQSKTSKNQQTRFVASHGDYQAIITLDALVGHDDQYNSTLTIVNTARYGGLLSPPAQ